MTERGLPIVGGAPACPFVAFDDDRDERATGPDHRHRCYAEAEPAPRALAHQEAYCLSSAFPVCPTFQDWARREAARARPPDVPPVESDLESDEEASEDDYPPLVSDRPPRRDARGAWAAPPPWLRNAPGPASPGQVPPDSAASARAAATPPSASPAPPPPRQIVAGLAAGGLSGSLADRMASDRVDAAGAPDDGPTGAPPGRAHGEAADDVPDRVSEPSDEGGEPAPSAAAPPSGRRRDRLDSGSDRIEAGRDLEAPSWERPRRLEAYPTLRSRRLPMTLVSPLLIGVAAVVLAAMALFVLPTLLGIGGPPAASPSPSIAESVPPTGSLEPSALPGPTPFRYTVQQGDTLTKIAKKFGVPLADLIAANKDTHPNPDVLSVGDVLVIPITTPTAIPGASLEASPSP